MVLEHTTFAAYWQARRELMGAPLWETQEDTRIQTLLSFITKIEQWYPLLTNAQDEAHYARLVAQTPFDLKWIQAPGPKNLEILRRAQGHQTVFPRFAPHRYLDEAGVKTLYSVPMPLFYIITEKTFKRLVEHLPEAAYPLQGFGKSGVFLGWPLCVWAWRADGEKFAWVTLNEGPWPVHWGDRGHGQWIPVDQIGFCPNILGAWGRGTPVSGEWFATPTKQELAEANDLCKKHLKEEEVRDYENWRQEVTFSGRAESRPRPKPPKLIPLTILPFSEAP